MQRLGRNGAAPACESRGIALWLAGCALLIAVRLPTVLGGRFWADDGPIFFGNAWRLPWQDALVAPYAGYVNFVANSAGLLAKFLPLEFAPYGPFAVSFAIQLAACAVLVTARDEWLARATVRATALAMMLLAPFSEEIWLNAATSHFHLLLAAALILTLDAPRGGSGVFRCSVLFLAPLAGPGPAALAPLALARLWWDRSEPRLAQVVALAAGLLILLLLHMHGTGQQRTWHLGLTSLACEIYVKNLLAPTTGLASLMVLPDCRGGRLPMFVAACVMMAGGLYAAVLWRATRRGSVAVWFAGAALSILLFAYGGALGGEALLVHPVTAARYAYAPQVLFALSLLSAGGFAGRFAAGWLLAVGIVTALLPHVPVFVAGPDWRAEVAHWRQQPTYSLRAWPAYWRMNLPSAAAPACCKDKKASGAAPAPR